jgi:uncharacterized membrane protein
MQEGRSQHDRLHTPHSYHPAEIARLEQWRDRLSQIAKGGLPIFALHLQIFAVAKADEADLIITEARSITVYDILP